MQQTEKNIPTKGIVKLLFITLFLMFALTAQAGTIEVEGAHFMVNASMKENLKIFVGKKINVSLSSGKTFSGVLKEVGPHLLHMEKMAGKEYFDAIIRIDTVQAFDSQFREFKR